MILRRLLLLGNLLPIRTVCPLLLGIQYLLQRRVRFLFCFWWVLCCLDISLRTVSDLILYLIPSEIFMVYIIPLFLHLYLLQVFLDPSDTTTTVMVSPIIMMMMLRAYYIKNYGSRWELEMMRLSVKITNLSQCITLPVDPHSFFSLLISDNVVTKALDRGLVLGR